MVWAEDLPGSVDTRWVHARRFGEHLTFCGLRVAYEVVRDEQPSGTQACVLCVVRAAVEVARRRRWKENGYGL